MLSKEVLTQYSLTDKAEIKKFAGGLINETYKVTEGDKVLVIQKMNKMYDLSTLEMYQMLYDHLTPKGVPMAKPIQTVEGTIGYFDEQNWYRATEYVENDPFDYSDITPEVATKLGTMLAKLHISLADFPHPPTGPKKEFHDTRGFLSALEEAAGANPFKAAMVASEIQVIITKMEKLLQNVPQKIATVHGDPKIFNYLFKDGEIVACVDFDGVRPGNIYLEIGDALRDWSMRDEKNFDFQVYAAALNGYRVNSSLDLTDSAAAQVTKLITLELAARFLTDFFHENYFAWDKNKYSTSAEHNLQRTRDSIQYYNNLKF